jgi:hypothetical protein
LWAVVKDCRASAVRPFVREAKVIFRAEAGPIVLLIWEILRMVEREGEISGEEGRRWGPEMGMRGFDQVESVGLRRGGPPIMPPSRARIAGEVKRAWISRAVAGLMALRLRK